MIRFEEETSQIIGACMAVHNELGNGFLEAVYQDALSLEFQNRGIPFVRERKIQVFYKGQKLEKEYFADFVCYDKIIVETKCVSRLVNAHKAQVINYLHGTGLSVGLLVNFAEASLKWERLTNFKPHEARQDQRACDTPSPASRVSGEQIRLSAQLNDAGDPYWIDVQPAGEFLSLPDRTILHSGPPIEYGQMCVLHRRGMVNACLFEGWAKTEAEADALLQSGEVRCEAAMDYATVGSGTGIVTAHVPLLIVEDRETGGRAGVFPGEGRFGGGFCGWGVYSPEIAANLAWMRDELFPPMAAVLRETGGFPMKALFAEARRMGDELHSSQRAIDALFTRAIIPLALRCPNASDLLAYFAETNRFTHNFGQAASRALLLGLEASGRRGFLTAAGGNGVEYGVKFSGETTWHTAPAPMIEGPYLVEGAKRENQLPWIGDSSITECRGWGGQIRPVNPTLGCAGNGPVINGGMIDRNGGWMGAGSTRIPDGCFVS